MSNFDYTVPTGDAEFDKFQNTLHFRLNTYGKKWELPEADWQKLKDHQVLWKEYRIKTFSRYHRTAADVKRKNEIKREYVTALRAFIKEWIDKNPKLTEMDRLMAGFKKKLKEPTTLPPPIIFPDLRIKQEEPLQVRVRSLPLSRRSRGGGKKTGMPQYMKYLQLVYDIGPHEGGPTECRFRVMLTKMFTTLYFDAADSGKPVTIYARYLNKNNEPGPWCMKRSFFIR